MIGYKLFRKMKDGYAPLFIDKTMRLKVGETYKYKNVPTKGFAIRPRWHIVRTPNAPHIKENIYNRVWCEVEFEYMETIKRPKSQGSTWYLGSKIKIIRELTEKKD